MSADASSDSQAQHNPFFFIYIIQSIKEYVLLLKVYHSHLQIGKIDASNLIPLSAHAASINEHQVKERRKQE